LATEPPIVPRARTCGSPTMPVISAKAGIAAFTSAEVSIST
jgi:hypothetical protein